MYLKSDVTESNLFHAWPSTRWKYKSLFVTSVASLIFNILNFMNLLSVLLHYKILEMCEFRESETQVKINDLFIPKLKSTRYRVVWISLRLLIYDNKIDYLFHLLCGLILSLLLDLHKSFLW